MNNDLRIRILHDLKRIGEAIKSLIEDLDKVPQEIDEPNNTTGDNSVATNT